MAGRLGPSRVVFSALVLAAACLLTGTSAAASPPATAMPAVSESTLAPAADEWLGPPSERDEQFDEYAETIKSGHLVSVTGLKRIDTTWERELERTRKRFLAASTRADVYYALLSLQRTLHDVHSTFTAPQALLPSTRAVALPFTLEVQGDSPAATRYVVTASTAPDVKPGWILEQYQGKAIAQLEYEYLEWLDSTSPEALKMELARTLTRHTDARRSPVPDPDSPVSVVFVDPVSQTRVSGTYRWQAATPEVARDDYRNLAVDYRGILYRTYKDAVDDTLIVVLESFNYGLRDAEFKARLDQTSLSVPPYDRAKPLEGQTGWMLQFLEANGHPQVDRFKRQGIRNYPLAGLLEPIDIVTLGKYLNQQTLANVLVDVSNNPGGNVNPDLIALFAAKPFSGTTRSLVYSPLVKSDSQFMAGALTYADQTMRTIIADQLKRDPAALESRRFPWNCKSAACPLQEAIFQPNGAIRKFHLAVLSGPRCASACEHFVATTKDNAMGPVIGLPSRGGSAPFRAIKVFPLANGQTFAMTLNTGTGYRPNGEPLEGNPAPMDYYLYPEDDYVAKLLRYLKEQGAFQ